MKAFPKSKKWREIARRVVWFKPPDVSLDDPIQLLAYAMKHSTDEDMAALIDHIGLSGIKTALDQAPPGVIDRRSWAYWNAKVGRFPAPPQPTRKFPE